MGNPIVSRLGRNQFWYKKWYTDLVYSSYFKKISTSETILSFFLKYGLFFKNNIFINNFWYKNLSFMSIKTTNQDLTHFNLYFRRYFYSYKTLAIEHSYNVRLETAEFFPLRLYVLKYLNWVVISVQWFKPLKNKLTLNKKNSPKNKTPLISKSGKNYNKYSRLKLIYFYLHTTLTNKNINRYTF